MSVVKEKGLKGLSRRDLLELLCRLKEREEALQAQVQDLQTQLTDRSLKIEKAGSLAEAMLSVNGVFEVAQRAADQYAEQMKAAREEADEQCAAMLAQTEKMCRRREEESTRRINRKWESFNETIQRYMETHSELEAMLAEESCEVDQG